MSQILSKTIIMPIHKGIQKTERNTLMVKGFYTSDNKDEVGDIITREASEKAQDAYRQWGNVRRMHLPDPVGKVRKMGTSDGLAWNEVEIEVIDPKAIFEVENELLPALSVGILVNFDDIDFLADGGWVINSYQLAEISLVDHPANYDATLDIKNLSTEERNLIREKGFSAGVIRRGPQETAMNKKTLSAETITDAVVEPPVEEVQPTEEPTAETAPQDLAVTPPIEAGNIELPDPINLGLEETILKHVTPLAEAIQNLQGLLERALEQPQPVAPTEPAPSEIVPEETSTVKELVGRVAELENRIKELSTGPAQAAIPTEEPPTEAAPIEEPVAEKPKNLKEALQKAYQVK